MNHIKCLFFSVLFSSCSVVGFNSGYQHLTTEQKNRVVNFDGNWNDLRNDGRVYRVTVPQMKALLEKEQDVVVYEFTSFCKSKSCVHPAIFERYCKDKGYYPVIISVIYDRIWDIQGITTPLLSIDTTPYNTNIRSKYQKYFFYELTGVSDKERDYHSFHHFHKGKYIKSYNEYMEIP